MNTRCHYVQGVSLEEWSERTGIKLGVLYSRLYRRGWTPEEAVGLVPHKRTYKPRQLDAPVLPAVSDEDAYTRDELYELWLGCRENVDALQIMKDFSLLSAKQARELMREFEKENERRTE